jgi:hypothetical protein
MKKHILYQSDYELHAFFVKGKKIQEVQRFQRVNEFEVNFTQYLSRNPKTPIYWLIDTTQEAYQTTLLPHVFGKDRRDLMAYKMRRFFEENAYTYGIVQGRETQGRKDDRVLFMALNDPNFLEPWLDLLTRQKIPLAGIYSLPLLSQHLLKHLPQAPYTLLVTDTPYSDNTGLRQTFFINQKLQFSRLIPLNISDIQERTQEILNQIITTQRYLDNERLLPESEPPQVLSAIILTNSQTCSVFNNQPPKYDPSTLNIHVLDSSDLALKIGIKTDSEKALYLPDFVANQISRSWFTKNHYASHKDRRYSFYRHLRQAFYFTSILLLSGATAKSAILLQDANSLKEKGLTTIEKTKSRQAEIEKLREKIPQLDLDILLIRNIVDVGYHLKALHLSPQPALEKLSYVLNRHNDLLIQRLKWGIGHSKTDIFETNTKTMKSEKRDNLFKELDFTKNFIEGQRLQGKIDNFKGDYLKASRIFKRFIKDLQRHFWKVDVLLEPYKPNQVLQGKIDSQAEVGEAPFTVDIFIKHSYPNEP